ncbi:p24 complex component [Nowakowskiella sp. JEL0078]|nr:p24 complex component [Nowakowskiella sp. JEL0078]
MSHNVVDVTFTAHGPDEQSKFKIKVEKTDQTALEKEIETELNHLADVINDYRDEASYIIERDIRHRRTAESTKSRVLWWSLIQTTIVIGVSVFQVWYMRRFFEVKRLI